MADQQADPGLAETRMVASLAHALFGPEWAHPLSHFVGTNPRTCQRIKKAAAEGAAYPAAKGVLSEFAARLVQVAETARPFAEDRAAREPRGSINNP